MSAYLFTGWTSQFRAGRIGDSCLSLVVYGSGVERARTYFEQWLLNSNQAEEPIPIKVEKIVVAPVLEHLFGESGPVPMEWLQVCEEAARGAEVGGEDAFEHGYWVDCNALISPDHLSPDIESLRGELPEDVRSGLNWSSARQYFYLVSALKPPAPPPETSNADDLDPVEAGSIDSDTGDLVNFHLNERGSVFPELADKEVAVVIRARNSIVAAWLWRRHAANTPLARNNIRVDPWYGAEKIEEGA
jgi:hypothetical protein